MTDQALTLRSDSNRSKTTAVATFDRASVNDGVAHAQPINKFHTVGRAQNEDVTSFKKQRLAVVQSQKDTYGSSSNGKRSARGEAGGESFQGPWAGYDDELDDLVAFKSAKVQKLQEFEAAQSAPIDHAEVVVAEQSTFYGSDKSKSWLDVLLKCEIKTKATAPRQPLHTFSGHKKSVNALCQLGNMLLSCSADKTVRVWRTNDDYKCLRDYNGHEKSVRDVKFSDGGRKFVSASNDMMLKLWDVEQGQVISRIEHTTAPVVLTCSKDINTVLCGHQDGALNLWDWRTGQAAVKYTGHVDTINSVEYLSDEMFVSTAQDGTMRVYNVKSQETYRLTVCDESLSLQARRNAFGSLARNPMSDSYVVQTPECLQVYGGSAEKYRLLARVSYDLQTSRARPLAISPNGLTVSAADDDGRVVTFNTLTGAQLSNAKADAQAVRSMAWGPRGLVTGSSKGSVTLWHDNDY